VLTSVRHPYIVMLHWSFQVSFDKTEGPEKPSNHVPTSVCHPRHCVSCGAGCCRRAAKRHLRVLIDIAMAIHGCTDIFHICLLDAPTILRRLSNRELQTAAKLYLVLDFVNGGHLFFNLYRWTVAHT